MVDKLKLKKNNLVIISFFAVFIIFIIFAYFRSQDKLYNFNKEYKKLLNLLPTYTAEQILRNKLADLNVTNVSSKPNYKVTKFIEKVNNNEWAILKTLSQEADELVVTLYYFDSDISEVKRYKFLVKKQAGLFPDVRFNKPYETLENGVATVYLTSINSNNSQIKDDIIYSYYKK